MLRTAADRLIWKRIAGKWAAYVYAVLYKFAMYAGPAAYKKTLYSGRPGSSSQHHGRLASGVGRQYDGQQQPAGFQQILQHLSASSHRLSPTAPPAGTDALLISQALTSSKMNPYQAAPWMLRCAPLACTTAMTLLSILQPGSLSSCFELAHEDATRPRVCKQSSHVKTAC